MILGLVTDLQKVEWATEEQFISSYQAKEQWRWEKDSEIQGRIRVCPGELTLPTLERAPCSGKASLEYKVLAGEEAEAQRLENQTSRK